MSEYNSIDREFIDIHITSNFRFPEFKDREYPNYYSVYVIGLDKRGKEHIVRLVLNSYVGCSMMEWKTYGNRQIFNFDEIVGWQPLSENPIKKSKDKNKSKPVPCANCGETVDECACMRNKCIKCGKPIGNITFTFCDSCWNDLEDKDDK